MANPKHDSHGERNGSQTAEHTDEHDEIAHMLVESLDLDIAPEDIEPDAPLFGEGLGLDSIDLLEIALVVSKRYGVRLTSEDRAAFASLRALATHIMEHRIQ
ncbi:acyl carrier protein [Nitrospira sp.]|nr:acyl carrier protein [Nitrospira sp.]